MVLLKDQVAPDGLLFQRDEEESVGAVNVLFFRLNGAETRVVLVFVDNCVATGFESLYQRVPV